MWVLNYPKVGYKPQLQHYLAYDEFWTQDLWSVRRIKEVSSELERIGISWLIGDLKINCLANFHQFPWGQFKFKWVQNKRVQNAWWVQKIKMCYSNNAHAPLFHKIRKKKSWYWSQQLRDNLLGITKNENSLPFLFFFFFSLPTKPNPFYFHQSCLVPSLPLSFLIFPSMPTCHTACLKVILVNCGKKKRLFWQTW